MKRVIAFGAFDPLTGGQQDYLRQAKAMGDYLTVVVAHDSAIRAHKKRDPNLSEEDRVAAVKDLGIADEVVLGRKGANKYVMLKEIDFDIVALGYNQRPTDEELHAELENIGKYNIEIIRCKESGTGALFASNKKTVAALAVVAVLVVIGLVLALRSGGKSFSSYDEGAPIKREYKPLSGWKSEDYGDITIHAPMGLLTRRDESNYVLTNNFGDTAKAYALGNTVVVVLRTDNDKNLAQSFIQSKEGSCEVSEVGDGRTVAHCGEDGGRFAYLAGDRAAVFIDAFTLRDGTSRDLSDDEFVQFVKQIEL